MSLNIVSDFPSRLAQALEMNNMKAVDLAKLIGMSKQAISTYATGVRSPKLPVIKIIAQTLNVDSVWLMGYDVPIEKEKPTSTDDELIEILKNPQMQEMYNKLKQLSPENLKRVQDHVEFLCFQEKQSE